MSLHNSIVPISRLPNELLSTIMYISYQESDNPPWTRLALSWVCKHWRNVAIGFSQLWCTIKDEEDMEKDYGYRITSYAYDSEGTLLRFVPINPDYALACIDRCGNMGLDVDLGGSLKRAFVNNRLLQLFTAQVHKIRSLTMSCRHRCSRNQISAQLSKLLDKPAPQLSSLSLTAICLPQVPFHGIFPSLHSLELVQCSFSWDFIRSAASTLTTLKVVDLKYGIDGDLLAEILSMMPQLVNLHLNSCLSIESEPINGFITLPSLRTLYVRDELSEVIDFFSSIKVPNIHSLRARIEEWPGFEDTELLRLLDIFKRLHPSLWNEVHHLILRPSNIEVIGATPGSSDMIILANGYLANSFSILYSGLAMGNLATLSIESWSGEVPEFIGELESIRTVRFNMIDCGGIHSLLSRRREQNGEMKICLPSLVEIHCNGPSEELYSALETRRDIIQRRLPQLTFYKCSYEEMKRFEEVADEVAVDGVKSVEPFVVEIDRWITF